MVTLSLLYPIGINMSYGADPILKCTILISMKIKPYLEAVEGIKKVFNKDPDIKTEFFFLEDVEKAWKTKQIFSNTTHENSSIIAVGPEAALFLKSNLRDKSIIQVITMVSNPSSLLPHQETSFCGFFLSVNARDQIESLNGTFPQIKSLGILYDERYNSKYIKKAKIIGSYLNINIIPLMVRSKDQVPALLEKNWKKIDGLLLIPDATVISASFVKYIIKDGIFNNVPVIGYNNFFIQSGALMAFVYDYEHVGMTTAVFARDLIMGKQKCRLIASDFRVVVNKRIVRYLGLKEK